MQNGLAQSMATNAPQQAPQQGGLPTVEQVAEMLMNGVDPEKLVQEGIPPELIMQAIEMIEQQMAAQEGGQQMQEAPAPAPQGLAQSMMGP
jgi:hypothetical protein